MGTRIRSRIHCVSISVSGTLYSTEQLYVSVCVLCKSSIVHCRGEILCHPENSFPQTIVLRYQEIGGILCTKQQSKGIVSI
jgi:hypothetical protein